MGKALTAKTVENLKPKADRYDVRDGVHGNLYLRVYPSGERTFRVHYRFHGERKVLNLRHIPLADARVLAAEAMSKVARDIDPAADKKRAEARAAGADSVKAIFEKYQQLDGAKLRTAASRRRTIERLVYPAIGHMPIGELRRGDIVRLLDKIEIDNGPVMADKTLAFVRKVLRWHSIRDENFASPIVPGMARTKPAERARERILTDDELRKIWKAAEQGNGAFSALVQFLLLTAARRAEAAELTWNEISGADWTLPRHRNKVKRDLVRPLSAAAQGVIDAQPRIAGCPFIFTTNGRKPLRGFAALKTAFDKRCGAKGWTLHDLRRTAKSLMSRAGVNSDHSERCLGHVIGGVRGVYDRHEYYDEKRQAYEALAAQIDRIVNPQPNVVSIKRKRG